MGRLMLYSADTYMWREPFLGAQPADNIALILKLHGHLLASSELVNCNSIPYTQGRSKYDPSCRMFEKFMVEPAFRCSIPAFGGSDRG